MSYSDDAYMMDSNGCFNCDDYSPKVKGRFGLAWVSESPDCPNPEPVGWQVEFLDTPSKVEQKCQEMVRWINCPPLPRCDPCPPVELCCNNNKNYAKQKCHCNKPQKEKCSCCRQQQQQQHQQQQHQYHQQQRENRKKCQCCMCGNRQRYPTHTSPCCNNRNRSPPRRRCGLPY